MAGLIRTPPREREEQGCDAVSIGQGVHVLRAALFLFPALSNYR
jgi:hypothetical protein